ncbi:MAG: GNAT family N-acetyltransferase, partial [Rhodospirillaceae bacterium]
ATSTTQDIHWPLSGRPGRLTDLPFILRQESRPEFNCNLIPWPRQQHLDAMAGSTHQYILFQDSMEQPMGYAILAGLTSPHQAIELVRLVARHPGIGMGRVMLGAVMTHAFTALEANRLWLDVFTDNARARHLYRALGFVEEGVLRDVIKREDSYRSLVIMSLLRREYHAMCSDDPPPQILEESP